MRWRSLDCARQQGLDVGAACGIAQYPARPVSIKYPLEYREGEVSDKSCSQFTRPSLSLNSRPLFWYNPPDVYQATKGNLEKMVGELVQDGETIVITDPALSVSADVTVKYE